MLLILAYILIIITNIYAYSIAKGKISKVIYLSKELFCLSISIIFAYLILGENSASFNKIDTMYLLAIFLLGSISLVIINSIIDIVLILATAVSRKYDSKDRNRIILVNVIEIIALVIVAVFIFNGAWV